jgi:hypothetical protein
MKRREWLNDTALLQGDASAAQVHAIGRGD